MGQWSRRFLVIALLLMLVACGGAAAAPPVSTSLPVAAVPMVTPTEAPTEALTVAPTVAPTDASTSAPTEASAIAETGELSVFAAASLTDAFGEIGTNFEAAHAGVSVVYNFAGSNQLAQQITQGAPVDVFASANTTQMNVVIDAGDIITGTQHTFVRNRLVVICPKDNAGQVATLQDLAKPGLKLVLASKEVPVGQYSLDFLGKASATAEYTAAYSETVAANVVSYEQNVRAVLSKVALGEADAGIVYSSDITADAADQVEKIDIPDELNTIASYPIAPLAAAPHPQLAQAFIAYVLAPEGQHILERYGFIPVGKANGAAP